MVNDKVLRLKHFVSSLEEEGVRQAIGELVKHMENTIIALKGLGS